MLPFWYLDSPNRANPSRLLLPYGENRWDLLTGLQDVDYY
jgi:hypothetical protein